MDDRWKDGGIDDVRRTVGGWKEGRRGEEGWRDGWREGWRGNRGMKG